MYNLIKYAYVLMMNILFLVARLILFYWPINVYFQLIFQKSSIQSNKDVEIASNTRDGS